jgi:hypothetical protein
MAAGARSSAVLSPRLPDPIEARVGRRRRPRPGGCSDLPMGVPSMPTANYLPDELETAEPERLATGFVLTQGPLWHPDGYWHFVGLRSN